MNAVSDFPADTPPRPSIIDRIMTWANRVRYMTFSALFHLILILTLGGTVMYKKYAEAPDFAAPEGGLFANESTTAPPQQDQVQIQNSDFSVSATAQTTSAPMSAPIAVITNAAATSSSFSMASISTPNISATPTKAAPTSLSSPTISSKGLSKGQASRIAAFTGGWAKGGTSAMSQPLKSRAFEFTAYLAKYAGGDWDATVWLDGDTVRGGSLHNLLYIISRLSHKKIHADPQPIPLDLASNEIFEKKPPFIWFTGHRDFVLSDQEVKNLGEYLRSGGCIWGDSSLPGQRSRFDIAFRREMLRILPELNQKWEALPAAHPIYTNGYYQDIKGVVPGMNFYREPIYGLKGFGEELAVIYTANDYGDMWQFGIDENGDFDLSRDEKRRFVAINEPMWHRKNLYFRNVEPKALMDTYKFGTNIIVHLLTRWEAKVRFAQRTTQ